jgi:hypothetical protein
MAAFSGKSDGVFGSSLRVRYDIKNRVTLTIDKFSITKDN